MALNFSGGNRARRGRRGKGRGRPASVKLEVKQEESVEVITGLAASESVETLKHQVCGSSKAGSNKGLKVFHFIFYFIFFIALHHGMIFVQIIIIM